MKNIDDARSSRIYARPANYTYAVTDIGESENGFLLFNPALHFWISLNASGAEIVKALSKESSLDDLANNLQLSHRVSEAEFNETVIPFVQQLLDLRFFGFQPFAETTV